MDFNSIYRSMKGRSKNPLKKRAKKRDQQEVVMDLFFALILCHNVKVVESASNEREFQA